MHCCSGSSSAHPGGDESPSLPAWSVQKSPSGYLQEGQFFSPTSEAGPSLLGGAILAIVARAQLAIVHLFAVVASVRLPAAAICGAPLGELLIDVREYVVYPFLGGALAAYTSTWPRRLYPWRRPHHRPPP